jgi:hypothetical protein
MVSIVISVDESSGSATRQLISNTDRTELRYDDGSPTQEYHDRVQWRVLLLVVLDIRYPGVN